MDWLRELFAEWYIYIKFIHIFFAFLWGLSAPAAFIFYCRTTRAEMQRDPANQEIRRRYIWAMDQFDKVVVLEHIAWPMLLITGPMLYYAGGWGLDSWWLTVKLAIILFFYFPVEIYDVWIAHHHAPPIAARAAQEPKAYDEMRELHWRFIQRVTWGVRLTVPLMYFLAIVKPF